MSFVRFLPLPSEVIELRIEWGAMPLWFEAAVLFFVVFGVTGATTARPLVRGDRRV